MSGPGSPARGGPILAIDTATTEALVAIGTPSARPSGEDRWVAGFRHGEELLARIDALLGSAGIRPADLDGLVVGTGPGGFTGLRVGLATAKGLAVALRVPLVGVPTAAALLEAARVAGARDPLALLLPAGPNDRVVVATDGSGTRAPARRLAGGEALALVAGTTTIALDLEGRATDEALSLGQQARAGLAAALLALGARRLAAGDVDRPEAVDAEYVTLPRGVGRHGGRVSLERV